MLWVFRFQVSLGFEVSGVKLQGNLRSLVLRATALLDSELDFEFQSRSLGHGPDSEMAPGSNTEAT